MSSRRIITPRRPAAQEPLNLNAPISTIPEIKGKRHLAYKELLGLPFLIQLYGTEELAKSKRDHTRRYLQRFVDKLIEEELFNGTIREFFDILKERLREKIAAGMSASPPREVAMRPAPRQANAAPVAVVVPLPLPRVRASQLTGNRRQRGTTSSSSSTGRSSNSQGIIDGDDGEVRAVRNPRLNQLALALGNMNVQDNQNDAHIRVRSRARPVQRQRLENPIEEPQPQLTQRQLDAIARREAETQAQLESHARREAATIASRQRRRTAPERRAAVDSVSGLFRDFGI